MKKGMCQESAKDLGKKPERVKIREGKRPIKEISVTAQLDGRFAHSPDVSGYRYVFLTESARGTFYIAKEIAGDDSPEEIALILRFIKQE